jgi:hypothetical protein
VVYFEDYMVDAEYPDGITVTLEDQLVRNKPAIADRTEEPPPTEEELRRAEEELKRAEDEEEDERRKGAQAAAARKVGPSAGGGSAAMSTGSVRVTHQHISNTSSAQPLTQQQQRSRASVPKKSGAKPKPATPSITSSAELSTAPAGIVAAIPPVVHSQPQPQAVGGISSTASADANSMELQTKLAALSEKQIELKRKQEEMDSAAQKVNEVRTPMMKVGYLLEHVLSF